jgi:hypothetical protein
VSLLLSAGANPNASDSLAGCALLAAVRKGHDSVITQLVAAGARLQLPAAELANALCNAVTAGECAFQAIEGWGLYRWPLWLRPFRD